LRPNTGFSEKFTARRLSFFWKTSVFGATGGRKNSETLAVFPLFSAVLVRKIR
jgi:hypothetical protein